MNEPRPWLAATVAIVLISAGCSGSNDRSNTTTRTTQPTPIATEAASIEPRPDLDPGTGCSGQFGLAKVNALFVALNNQDFASVQAMFPTSGEMEFTLSPDIATAAESSVTGNEPSVQAFSNADLAAVVARLSGMHLVFTAAPPSGTYTDTVSGKLFAGVSPLMWRATGPGLEQRGKVTAVGGGKTAIDCETGLFVKVLLSPLHFE